MSLMQMIMHMYELLATLSQKLWCWRGLCSHLMCGASERTVTCKVPNLIPCVTKGGRPEHSPALLSPGSMCVLAAEAAAVLGLGFRLLAHLPTAVTLEFEALQGKQLIK